jgi:bifunctional isochorismate lyase/aryl carrier protein
MGIPTIEPYPLPSADQLPANTATWRPEPHRAVLLVHDMQQYFVDFFPPGEPVTTLVAHVRQLLDAARALGIPVVYTAQPGSMTPEQRGLLRDFWGTGMRAEAADRRIVDALAPTGADTVLTKWRYSAFHRTGLAGIFADSGRDQLIVCGVYAHVGCLMTACDAFSRDIQPFFVADAVADFTPADHHLALDYAARRCAAVLTTGQVLAHLGAQVDARDPARVG